MPGGIFAGRGGGSGGGGAAVPMTKAEIETTLGGGFAGFDPVVIGRAGGMTAIGDGTKRALSTVFGTLTAARTFFGKKPDGVTEIAGALTDSIDACVIQKAISSAYATTFGGKVVLRPGKYMMGGYRLQFKDTTDVSTTWLRMSGDVLGGTMLKWDTDGAVGDYAAALPTRTQVWNAIFENMYWEGPGSDVALGSSPCNLSGLAGGKNIKTRNMKFRYWRAGLGLQADHTRHDDLTCEKCFYGVYFDTDSVDMGDHFFFNANIGTCFRSCFGVSLGNQMEKVFFFAGHFGWTPYIYYKEATGGAGGSARKNFITNCKWDKFEAESVGNCVFYVEQGGSAGAMTSFGEVTKSHIQNIQHLQSDTYKIANQAVAFCIVNRFWYNTIQGPHTIFGRDIEYGKLAAESSGMTSAYLGYFMIRDCFQSNNFIGGGYLDLGLNASSGKPVVGQALNGGDQTIFRNKLYGDVYDGELIQMGGAGGAAVKGDLVGRYKEGGLPITASMMPRGAAQSVVGQNQGLIVATRGLGQLKKAGATAIAADALLEMDGTDPKGVKLAVNAPASGTRSIIGVYPNGNGGGAGAVDWAEINLAWKLP